MKVQRLCCKSCGCVHQESLPFVTGKRTYTNKFARFVISLSRIGTIKDIAKFLQISWDIVKDIQKRYLKRHYTHPNLQGVRYIGIDEFAVAKGHKYMTIVVDLETGIVLYVGEGKGSDALIGFWKRIKKEDIHIEAVATDLSPAFISSVMTNAPEAVLVFDHFHVVKLLNDALDEIRRDLYSEEKDLNKKQVTKGIRWLLLGNGDHIDKNEDMKKRLDEALKINKPLAEAYYLKEELRELWNQTSKEKAEVFLIQWTEKAKSTTIQKLKRFANTLLAHRTGILAWYDFRISTGPIEGINNKIKTMKRQAYGYRDKEFFKLKILSLHEKNYALVG
jgi:transposase